MFRATATKVEYLEKDARGKEPRILVTFQVHEIWKGPERSTAWLRTVYNKWTCTGYFFKAGREYLVAAEQVVDNGSEVKPAELAGIFLCGGTADIERARGDIEALGPGTRIDEAGVPSSNQYPTRSAMARRRGPRG